MRTITELLADIDTVRTWLAHHGAPNGGRLEEYRANLQNAMNDQARGEAIADYPAFFSAVMEIDDLQTAMSLPEEVVQRHRRKKLQPIWTGEPYYVDVAPDDQDQGRDTIFEFVVARQFMDSGYTIDFEEPSDVVAFEGDDVAAVAECKRPKTAGGLDRSIVRASQQLAEARHTGIVSPGVIALDCTRLVNPDFRYVEAATEAQAFALLDQVTNAAIIAMRPYLQRAWQDAHADARTDGIALRVRTMFRIANARLFVATMWRVAITTNDPVRQQALVRFIERWPGFEPGAVQYAGAPEPLP